MKLVSILFALFLVAPAFAAKTTVFTCKNKAGYTYTANTKYGEITAVDKYGNTVVDLDGLRVRSFDAAGFHVTTFIDSDDADNIVFSVFEKGNLIGAEHGRDKSLRCTRR